MSELPQTSGFQTTRWSLVLNAAGSSAALDELLRDYWGPMYAFTRRYGHNREDAADLVQEFIAQRMVSGALLSRADPERGRFRTFLKQSLKNFLTDQTRRDRTLKRSPRNGEVLRGVSLDDLEPRDDDDPSSAFDRQWVTTLLSRTMGRVREECEAANQQVHWRAFELVVLAPVVTAVGARALADVANELGLESAHQVSSMVQTVHRKFRRLLRVAIEETVADPGDADAEFLELRAFLGLPGE